MKRFGRYVAGQSGNKKGRPRGAKNRKTILEELFWERHHVTQAGAPVFRSTYELILMTVRNLAMRGNLQAFSAYSQLLESCGPEKPPGSYGILIAPEMEQSCWEE